MCIYYIKLSILLCKNARRIILMDSKKLIKIVFKKRNTEYKQINFV